MLSDQAYCVSAPTETFYSAKQVHAILKAERKRTRRTMRAIWFISMVITVMIATSLRKQQFVELAWYYVPLVSVIVNGVCFYLAINMMFGKSR
jgi:predicted nucleic acid-binding Zn ribbon protein